MEDEVLLLHAPTVRVQVHVQDPLKYLIVKNGPQNEKVQLVASDTPATSSKIKNMAPEGCSKCSVHENRLERM